MAPAARPGRRKVALLQDRIKRGVSLHQSLDYPENLADLGGAFDFWLKSLKAFRWHDAQLDLDPGHTVTRMAIANMLGIGKDKAYEAVKRFLFRHKIRQKEANNSYRWVDIRLPLCQKMASTILNEVLQLVFEMHLPDRETPYL